MGVAFCFNVGVTRASLCFKKVRGWVSPTASRVSYVLQRVLSYWLHVNKPSKTLDFFESLGIDAHADQPLKQQLSIESTVF
ncbi:hypothetical protein NC652_013671 [Populus alba x Populus x berolinensis]|nr:hypothetical protein NC652_013671 [Populus alba x Populus x berolinensis]